MNQIIKLRYYIVFCISIAMICDRLCAQADRFPSERDNKIVVELNYLPAQKINLPVNGVEILDARYEQAYIGATTGKDRLLDNEFTKMDIVFPEALDRYLSKAIGNWFSFSANADYKLVILVKEFRTNENMQKMLAKSKRKEVFFLLSVSYYLQKEDICYKIGSLDKWFSSDQFLYNVRYVKNDYHEGVITNVFLDQLQQLQYKIPAGAPSFTRSEMDRGIRQRVNLPIFTEKVKKGVYRSFRDFIQNKPTDTVFKTAVTDDGDIFFVDRANVTITSANAWAISDGQTAVFMFGKNFYRITLHSHSIRIRTHRKLNEKKTIAIIDDLYNLGLISKKTRKLFAFTDMPNYLDVNMDTGELFLEEIVGPYKAGTVTEIARDL
jgi:hypothetical protein